MNKMLTFALLGLSAPAFASSAPRHAHHAASTTQAQRPAQAQRPGQAPSRAPSSGANQRTIVYPTPGRPGNTVVHTTPNRPGNVVVHHTTHGTYVHNTAAPGYYGHGTVVHGTAVRPVPPPVHTVTYTHVYPYHGVFVYGPRPVTHVTYVNEAGPVQVQRRDLPKREVDRNDTFALGLKAGTLVSGTPDGNVYGDPGLGLVAQYRPAEEIGLEAAVSHHGMALDDLNTRSQTQVAGSVDLYAFPWSRVSPYALAGVTWNSANLEEPRIVNGTTTTVDDVSAQLGLHAGLGLELALGKAASIDLEGRYIGWVSDSTPESPSAPGALQATAGVLVHFK